MGSTPALRVTLLLNIQRQKNDSTRSGTTGAQVRRSFLDDRLARIVASERVL
jgi:hypothetical protein